MENSNERVYISGIAFSTNRRISEGSVNYPVLVEASKFVGHSLFAPDGSKWGDIIDAEIQGESVVLVVEFEDETVGFYPVEKIRRSLGLNR